MFFGLATTTIVGIICILLGISNIKGNISSIHSYHRSRVTPENVKPFGRMVGIGTIIIGSTVILFGGCMLITELTSISAFTLAGIAIMIAGMAVGMIMNFYAMKKYNNGVF